MENLLSKEDYCYKIRTSLTKSSVYPPFYRQPPIWITPSPPPFLQKNLEWVDTMPNEDSPFTNAFISSCLSK